MKFLRVLLPAVLLMASCGSCEKEKPLQRPGVPNPDTTVQEDLIKGEAPQSTSTTDTVKSKKPSNSWDTYVLGTGEHYNNLRRFSTFRGDKLHFKFQFDSTAIYSTVNPENQADWNKLMGFSDCGSLHQTNSVRLVWRWYQGQLQIGEYRYQNGNREYSFVTEVKLGEVNNAMIKANQDSYEIKVNEVKVHRGRACNSRTASYWLFPYFGGDEEAPHDIFIKVQHLAPQF